MASSRTFHLLHGLTVEKVGEATVAFLRNSKGLIAEGGRAQGGYFVQAKSESDSWKSISGMTQAVQVQLIEAGDNVVVNCDFGKWSDKVGAGVIGWFVFAPLAVTAAIGAHKQSKLPGEILAFIENYIISGGVSAVVGLGAPINEGKIECPRCRAVNEKGQKFCMQCGYKLGRQCAKCGADIDSKAVFCPQCGENPNLEIKCSGCGADLVEGQRFCSRCGAERT
jgi:hypothetical protein